MFEFDTPTSRSVISALYYAWKMGFTDGDGCVIQAFVETCPDGERVFEYLVNVRETLWNAVRAIRAQRCLHLKSLSMRDIRAIASAELAKRTPTTDVHSDLPCSNYCGDGCSGRNQTENQRGRTDDGDRCDCPHEYPRDRLAGHPTHRASDPKPEVPGIGDENVQLLFRMKRPSSVNAPRVRLPGRASAARASEYHPRIDMSDSILNWDEIHALVSDDGRLACRGEFGGDEVLEHVCAPETQCGDSGTLEINCVNTRAEAWIVWIPQLSMDYQRQLATSLSSTPDDSCVGVGDVTDHDEASCHLQGHAIKDGPSAHISIREDTEAFKQLCNCTCAGNDATSIQDENTRDESLACRAPLERCVAREVTRSTHTNRSPPHVWRLHVISSSTTAPAMRAIHTLGIPNTHISLVKELQYPITDHCTVPKYNILTKAQIQHFVTRLGIPDVHDLPVMWDSDPQATARGYLAGNILLVTPAQHVLPQHLCIVRSKTNS